MLLPGSYEYPKSSLLGMPKDASIIIERIMSNQNVLKLLTYNTRDWKDKPDITPEQVANILASQQVSSVPKIVIDHDTKTYIRLIYGTTVRSATNPQYRDNTFGIDIICHHDTWNLGDFEMRPYRIAGEIDSMLDNTRLTGIGLLEFISCAPYVYNSEFQGVTLTYLAVRGQEDKVNPLNG